MVSNPDLSVPGRADISYPRGDTRHVPRPEGELREKRQYHRTETRLRCWCEGENVTFYARVGNLSEGGLFLRTSTPLDRGSVAKLRFGVKEAAEVEARATVVWSRHEAGDLPSGMGLRFDDVDEKVLEAIRRIVWGERVGKQS
jgi:uncharacterized protein (TIGR02266 family)